jgi:hypothetical protein
MKNKGKIMKSNIKRFKISDDIFEAVDKWPDEPSVRPKVVGDKISYINCDPEYLRFVKAENEWAKSVGEPTYSYFVTRSLTSAYTWGFDNIDKYDAQKSKVVNYNLDERWVDIDLVRTDSYPINQI